MAKNDKDNTSTKSKLIKTGIKLFSTYGYAATSTRMIAKEAEVSLSAIAFYFSTKESLYVSCLEQVLNKTNEYYAEPVSKIEDEFARGSMSKEKAYEYIIQLVDLQIIVAFERRYKKTLALVYWEQINPMSGFHPLTNSVFNKAEKVMADLLCVCADITREKAIITSRFINGSIISFGEHKLLVERSLNLEEEAETLPDWIREDVRIYAMEIVDRLFDKGM